MRTPLASLDSCLEIMLTEDLSTEERRELIRDLQSETYNTLKTWMTCLPGPSCNSKGNY
ncbi:MAG: hypothetical protein U5L96_05145 [Owenweeksia sp.]|nr:hypothetical protein [Owenweeksia sp.]